ncbi:hypothetical protein E0Z10_g10265 [Xylaria hypoxylon]|uniref:Allergen n=1 Tax=Xylaria hypoxylon TaxID=37992 RepID=A0A4Z0Y402_9PEZI|nr:hypothetical protein E0Z10_g10265 [Xylaria hypoxylon]
MDAASTAFNKILHRGSKGDEQTSPGSAGNNDSATIDRHTAAAVEHETIHKKHEHREQQVIDRERHQDHHKTTVQPLKERNVVPVQHEYEQADVQRRHFNHDKENDAKVLLERKQRGFENTSEEAATQKKTVQEQALTSEHVHHHLHETIQPVIEKETVMPSVTHKTIPIKEVHHDKAIDEGITFNPPMSREEFEGRMRK